MKNLAAALAVFSLIVISCGEKDESHSTNQSEIQPTIKSGDTGEIKNSVPQVTTGSSIPQATGLSVKATAPTVIKLKWDSVPNATTYWIYRNDYVPAIVPRTNYTDTALRPGTKYTYTIAPVVNSVLGPKTVSVTVTTPR